MSELLPKVAKLANKGGDEGLCCACPVSYALEIYVTDDGAQCLYCRECGAHWVLQFSGYFEPGPGLGRKEGT